MTTPNSTPTPDPDINALLRALLADAQAVLGDEFVGMVVHGSLASGDFAPQRSDIDFLVVTRDELSPATLGALEAMHARITAGGMKWASVLEGSYIPQKALRRYDPPNLHHPALRVDGSFGVDGHGSEWIIQRSIIREKGIALAGPPPQTLIDPISPDELRRAAAGILFEWWEPQLADHSRLVSDEYQAYAILTMCRSLYTFHFGVVGSKPVAARWAQGELGQPWAGLIAKALAWGHGDTVIRLDDTLDLIRYTLAGARRRG
ncbi:MAG: DUF4111 domain-containing protein [Chloroflexi bacterium]|nr:DUF4111 domain-containing protein [Chloroflexota bacterium]